MQINPSEITKLLKEQIKNFGEKAEVSEIGKVLSVGDGIARIYGLDNVEAGEMVEFEDGSKGSNRTGADSVPSIFNVPNTKSLISPRLSAFLSTNLILTFTPLLMVKVAPSSITTDSVNNFSLDQIVSLLIWVLP